MLIRVFRFAMLLLLLVGSGGCSGGSSGSDGKQQVLFSRPEGVSRFFSNVNEPQEHVFTDEASWQAFGKRYPEFGLPEVDFSVWNVAAVFAGARSSGGYVLTINRIEQDGSGGQLRLFAVEQQPGNGCAVPGAVTFPADVVLYPKSATPAFGQVEWVRTTEKVHCTR